MNLRYLKILRLCTLVLAYLDRTNAVLYVSKDCKILERLKGNKEVYRAGDSISGECVLELTEPLTVKGVRVYIHGQALVKWEDTELEAGYSGGYVIPRVKTIERISREQYFAHLVTVFGKKVNQSGPNPQLPIGLHRWGFSFRLPNGPLPSSFEGEHGAIRYWLKVEIDKPFPWPNIKRYRGITVLDDLNLNLPVYKTPVKRSNEKIVSKVLGLGNAGELKLSTNIDKTGYSPGEKIGISATMVNGSTKDLGRSKAKLIQRVKYMASGKEKDEECVISVIEGSSIAKGVTKQWNWETLMVHVLPPSSKSGSCHIITVSYHIKMYVEVPFGFDLHVYLPIVIGTVPAGCCIGTQPSTGLKSTSYTKCNKGSRRCCRDTQGFPYLAYTPMSPFVQGFRFVPPALKPAAKVNSAAKGKPVGPSVAAKTSKLPAIESVCLLVRFDVDRINEFRETLKDNRGSLDKCCGELVALAPQVTTVDGIPWSANNSLAIFVFQNKDKAKDWVRTTQDISQDSWLGGCDIFSTAMRQPQDDGKTFYSSHVSRWKRSPSAEEISQMGKICTPQMRKARNVNGGVLLFSAGTKNFENIRGSLVSPRHILTCCQWPSANDYYKFKSLLQTEGEYKVAVDFSAQMLNTESTVTFQSASLGWLTEEETSMEPQVDTAKSVEEDETVAAVCLLLRFTFNTLSRLQDMIKKNTHSLRQRDGQLIVFAPQVMTLSGEQWPADKGIIMFTFDNKENAKYWFENPTEDEECWPEGVDAMLVDMLDANQDDNGVFTSVLLKTKSGITKDDGIWVKNECIPLMKSLRLQFGGALLFKAGVTAKTCEVLQGDWLSSSYRFACTQWPDASKYLEYTAVQKTGKYKSATDRLTNMVDIKQRLMFQTVDLGWLNDDDDNDDDNGGCGAPIQESKEGETYAVVKT